MNVVVWGAIGSVTVAAILLGLTLWWLRRPIRYRRVPLSELQRYLVNFVRTMDEGAMLFVKHEESQKFIQFARGEDDAGRSSLWFGFPGVAWSDPYFESISELTRRWGLRPYVDDGAMQGIERFLFAELNDETEKLAGTVFSFALEAASILDLSANSRFCIWWEGADRLDWWKAKEHKIEVIRRD